MERRAKRHFEVWKGQRFLGSTWAVSERKAINNVCFRENLRFFIPQIGVASDLFAVEVQL